MKNLLTFLAVLLIGGTGLFAQDRDISGSWQGTLHAENNLRIVLKIAKDDAAGLKATMYSIDQGGRPTPVGPISFKGGAIKFSVPSLNGTYEGKLANTDGTAITGVWTQGPNPLPLDLTLATKETAWEIPEPPQQARAMAADAKPEFEVATIKPSEETTRFSIHPTPSGSLIATAATLSYLIKFAYEVHPRQLTKAPAWIETEKYDLTAKPDRPGQPSLPQMRKMVQKLLADRFQLRFHPAKTELPAYAVTIAKGGLKITKNETNPNGNPGYGGGPNGMRVVNSTIAEFIGFILNDALDKPVVDQTGLGGARYDFLLKWTPDGPQAPGTVPNPDAPPDIFAAMQQQLGLKLESTKAMVDVFVIDKVEKPSEN